MYNHTMPHTAPSLHEITQLTRAELSTPTPGDALREAGRAARALLTADPELALTFAYQKLHDVKYVDVGRCWRRLYVDAALWVCVGVVEGRDGDGYDGCGKEGGWVDEVVRRLDMALILTGAPGREEVVELWFEAVKGGLAGRVDGDVVPRLVKRRRLSLSSRGTSRVDMSFPSGLPDPVPVLQCPIPRTRELSHAAFQKKVGSAETHVPVIIEGAIQHWPALEGRPWKNPGYLMEQTLGGRRLVPVEVGKSYTDDAWGQRIVTFKEFMDMYMLDDRNTSTTDTSESHESTSLTGTSTPPSPQTGYLAQHDLFAQIPSLRADISIPDYCYSDPAPSSHAKPLPKLADPLLNAWFGPARTVSPLHTDPYHNILAQVVGHKYIRLYAPSETDKLYPRGVDESGVDMSNTSQVDLDEGMVAYPEISCWADAGVEQEEVRERFEEEFPGFKGARYVEGVLGPGDCLYIPVGWWHYVGSLTPSFSVSFWFN